MNIYAPLEHALGIPWVLQAAALAALLLVLAGLAIRRRLAVAADGGLLPDEGLTIRNAGELIVEMLSGLARQAIGEKWRRYMPLVGTIFVFILLSNLMGLVPGLGGATSDASAPCWRRSARR